MTCDVAYTTNNNGTQQAAVIDSKYRQYLTKGPTFRGQPSVPTSSDTNTQDSARKETHKKEATQLKQSYFYRVNGSSGASMYNSRCTPSPVACEPSGSELSSCFHSSCVRGCLTKTMRPSGFSRISRILNLPSASSFMISRASASSFGRTAFSSAAAKGISTQVSTHTGALARCRCTQIAIGLRRASTSVMSTELTDRLGA